MMKPSELISERGWVQGQWGREDIGFCAQGAIYHIYGRYSREADWVIGKISRRLKMPICEWNDVPRRRVEEVVALLQEMGE